MNPSTQSCWLALSRLPLGARARRALLERLGSVEHIFDAPRAEIERVLAECDMRDRKAALDTLGVGLAYAEHTTDVAWLRQPDCHLVTWLDADYPALLREIADPPMVLYVHGDRATLAHPQIAIVGSRNPTSAGKVNAQAFACALARAGLAITSGLALGIDGAAHQGALDAGGVTIAVAGTGLDRVYPPRHRALAHAIVARGALVSEFPLGTPPRAEHFPVRNRLISGLSLGVLVIEAAMQSGSLITARLAGEQGREVYAVPGSIHAPQARGCHALIRQGAKLVETAADVLEELKPLAQVARSTAIAASECVLAPEEEKFLALLGYDPVTIDALVENSGLTTPDVSSMLSRLEMRGLVAHGAGGTYQRLGGVDGIRG